MTANGHTTRRKLYYYTSEKYGLLALQKRRLKVARIGQLNDPFEFLAPTQKERYQREALRSLKKTLDGTKGILCFSESRKNPVMWAHYADKHQGVCFGFDVAANDSRGETLGRVTYVDNRQSWPDGPLGFTFAQSLLLTKFSHWRYEQEWRAFMDLSDCEQCGGHYFKPFGEDLILREVYLGIEFGRPSGPVQDAVDGLPRVRLWRTRIAFQTFEVVQDKRK